MSNVIVIIPRCTAYQIHNVFDCQLNFRFYYILFSIQFSPSRLPPTAQPGCRTARVGARTHAAARAHSDAAGESASCEAHEYAFQSWWRHHSAFLNFFFPPLLHTPIQSHPTRPAVWSYFSTRRWQIAPGTAIWTPHFRETLGGSFSAVSTPMLELKGLLKSSHRDLHNNPTLFLQSTKLKNQIFLIFSPQRFQRCSDVVPTLFQCLP